MDNLKLKSIKKSNKILAVIFSILFCCILTPNQVSAQVSTAEIENEVNAKLYKWLNGFSPRFRKNTANAYDVVSLGGGKYKATGDFTYFRIEGVIAHEVDYEGDFTVYFRLSGGDVSMYKLCIYKVYNEKKCKTY